jgi:hypothetical protein
MTALVLPLAKSSVTSAPLGSSGRAFCFLSSRRNAIDASPSGLAAAKVPSGSTMRPPNAWRSGAWK